MNHSQRYYKRSIFLASILFIAIACFAVFNLTVRHVSMSVAAQQITKIVQAVTVNQIQVQTEINKIQAARAAKKQKELARQKHLQQLVLQAKQARLAEQKRLTILKQKQQSIEKIQKVKAQAEASKLSALQKQVAAQKKALIVQHKKMDEQKLMQQIAAEKKQIAAVHARQIQTEIEKYKALILNTIGQNWIMPKKYLKNSATQLLIQLAPGGIVLHVNILKSSGNPILDRSAMTAVWKASPLPVPNDSEAFGKFRQLHLTVRPEGVMTG